MVEMMIRMHKQEMDKYFANGDLKRAEQQRENLEYFLNEYKKATGKDYELEETSQKIIDSLTKMDNEAVNLERGM